MNHFSLVAGVTAVGLASSVGFAQELPGGPLSTLSKLKNYEAKRASSCDPDLKKGNADARPIEPGATLVVADLKGPGVITHIWNTIAAEDRAYPRLLTFRMYWDDEKEPSVESPIGDFFGVGHGKDAPFQSLPVSVASDGRGRNCYWPMPFRKSAKITVTNEGKKRVNAFYYYVDWHKVPKLDEDEAYFHAQYRQEFPPKKGVNYLIADIKGRGHYVGTVMSCNHRTRDWWGEGDDFIFIDGEEIPSLQGTGTEDYFCDGWGFRKFSGPYTGCTYWDSNERQGAQTTVYRWHIPDPIPFKKSLRFEIEHMGVTHKEDGSFKSGFEERFDDLSSVAFWYQTEPHQTFPALPSGPDRLYIDMSKIQEGEKLMEKASATGGPIENQELGGCSSGHQLFWKPEKEGETLTVKAECPKAGKYDILMLLTTSYDYGIFEIAVDGKVLDASADLYSASVTQTEKSFATAELAAGTRTITFKNKGKNAASKGYFFGLDGVLLDATREAGQ